MKYKVVETIVYEVDAESEDQAVKIIVDAADRDKYFDECVDRFAYESNDDSEADFDLEEVLDHEEKWC